MVSSTPPQSTLSTAFQALHVHDLESHGHGHGRGGAGRGRRWQQGNYFFIASLAAALFFMYTVSIGLRKVFHVGSAHEALSCAARLSEQGLNFGDEGSNANQYSLSRRKVYETMAADVGAKGLKVGGVITQGLTQADLFQHSSSLKISPILKALDVPVRAMVLPILDSVASRRIRRMVDHVLVPALPRGSLWLQDDRLYHATLYHASSHAKPVPANQDEVAEEARLIRGVTSSTCPISATLERIIITSSGVVVACWQVMADGAEPAEIRRQLGQTLPNAPSVEGQMVKEPSMLHTTIARLLLPPSAKASVFDSQAVVKAIETMSNTLCGLHTSFNEVWFVEELDLLALALDGRYVKHPAPMHCPTA